MIKILLILFSFQLYAMDNESKQAEAFVVSISDKVISIVKNAKNDEEKELRLANIIKEVIAYKEAGRLALGQYWKETSNEEKEKFLDLYQKYLISKYLPRFKDYNGQNISFKGVVKKGNDFIVRSEIAQPNTPSVAVEYLVKKYNDKFKILDINAEGVSFIATQRSEFSSYISRKGFPRFLKALEKKVNKK